LKKKRKKGEVSINLPEELHNHRTRRSPWGIKKAGVFNVNISTPREEGYELISVREKDLPFKRILSNVRARFRKREPPSEEQAWRTRFTKETNVQRFTKKRRRSDGTSPLRRCLVRFRRKGEEARRS